jgi:hypothetical protein
MESVKTIECENAKDVPIVPLRTGSFRGFVSCNPVGQDGKPVDNLIGEFSFNRQGETAFRTTDDDPLYIDSERDAAYIVLHFLNDAFDNK